MQSMGHNSEQAYLKMKSLRGENVNDNELSTQEGCSIL
jgi:hypothetical protein